MTGRGILEAAAVLLAVGCVSADGGSAGGQQHSAQKTPLVPAGSAAQAGTTGTVGAGAQGMTPGTSGSSMSPLRTGGGAAGTTSPNTPIGAAGTGSLPMSTATAGTVGSMAGNVPAAGTGSVSNVGPAMTSKDPKIPEVQGDCPPFAQGTMTMDFMGLKGVIFEVGPKMNGTGSLIFYWHGTGSFSGEYASSSFQGPQVEDLKSKGGILVSPQSGTGTGGDCSGTGTFYEDDFKIADQIAACAVRDWNIDPHRIYSTGCSAGGLMAGCMGLMRSSYMAAVVPNSGGVVFPIPAEDPGHVPSAMTIHGAPGQDVVIVDFSDTSKTYDMAIKGAGGFVVNCNHGGGHCGLPALDPAAAAAGWQFMQDHPFGVDPEPYTSGLPASFPDYCQIF